MATDTGLPDYRCPGCDTAAGLVISPVQAFCGNEDSCRIITFNPSLPDGGLSQAAVINLG